MLVMTNNLVACYPFKEQQTKSKSKLATIGTQNTDLLDLVVFKGNNPDDAIHLVEGDVVYVKPDCATRPWAKEKFTIDGYVWDGAEKKKIEFLLVPVNEILGVDKDLKKAKLNAS